MQRNEEQSSEDLFSEEQSSEDLFSEELSSEDTSSEEPVREEPVREEPVREEPVREEPAKDIFEAIRNNDLELLKDLISKGADLAAKNEDGILPIGYAVEHDRWASIEVIASSKCETDDNYQYGDALLSAVKEDRGNTAEILLRANAKISWIYTDSGNGILHTAVDCRNLHMLKLLLAFGAAMTAKNKNNQTPLAMACNNRFWDGAALLVQYAIEHDIQIDLIEDEYPGKIIAEQLAEHNQWALLSKIMEKFTIRDVSTMIKVLVSENANDELLVDRWMGRDEEGVCQFFNQLDVKDLLLMLRQSLLFAFDLSKFTLTYVKYLEKPCAVMIESFDELSPDDQDDVKDTLSTIFSILLEISTEEVKAERRCETQEAIAQILYNHILPCRSLHQWASAYLQPKFPLNKTFYDGMLPASDEIALRSIMMHCAITSKNGLLAANIYAESLNKINKFEVEHERLKQSLQPKEYSYIGSSEKPVAKTTQTFFSSAIPKPSEHDSGKAISLRRSW